MELVLTIEKNSFTKDELAKLQNATAALQSQSRGIYSLSTFY
jgi:hypothetical protein